MPRNEIFTSDLELRLESQKSELIQKRADNVKIVRHPGYGIVYICPFPRTHFSDLIKESKQLRLQK